MFRPSLRPLNTVYCPLLTAYCLLFTSLITACTPAPAPTPTPALTDTPLPTATLPPSPTPTATVTPVPVSAICSPLTWHPLDELPLVVSWPFNPDKDVRHFGVDLSHWHFKDETSSLHEPVQAALDGKTAGVVSDRLPYGNMILIETPYTQLSPALIERLEIPPGQSLYHLYAHLADPPAFQIGQPVSCGQFLNRVGLTGWAVTAHLHFETRWGPPDFTFTVMAYYTADASPEEMANYETWFSSGLYQAFDPMILLTLLQP
ncbi:MAG: hypothetical protein FD146_1070 [Anaerolineaceae bacterium]|nr:MAG: hypothetical protein FD146_1070 [Anaerolineaceae bacterium]